MINLGQLWLSLAQLSPSLYHGLLSCLKYTKSSRKTWTTYFPEDTQKHPSFIGHKSDLLCFLLIFF